jgi:hypothetical protein
MSVVATIGGAPTPTHSIRRPAMLGFFHTKERIKFLLFVAAIATPILIISAVVVSNMESSAAAAGEPNSHGGLHYRIQEEKGAKALPPALASLLTMPAGAVMTDVNLDTDGAGKVVSAVITAFVPGDFASLSAFHRPAFNPVTNESPTSLWGNRDGYQIKIDEEKRTGSAPIENAIKLEYYINPIKPAKS